MKCERGIYPCFECGHCECININYCREKKPPIGEEVLFIFDDIYHIGYLVSDDGSHKPRKWTWFSYIKGYEIIEDTVDIWFPLKEMVKKDDG